MFLASPYSLLARGHFHVASMCAVQFTRVMVANVLKCQRECFRQTGPLSILDTVEVRFIFLLAKIGSHCTGTGCDSLPSQNSKFFSFSHKLVLSMHACLVSLSLIPKNVLIVFFFKFCSNEYDYLNTTPTTTTTKCVHFETPFSVLIKAAFWDLAFCVLQMLTASWAAQHSLKAYRLPGCDRKIYRDDNQTKLREAQHLIVSFVCMQTFSSTALCKVLSPK